MSEDPERQRERLRQQELKDNPLGNLNDASNRASTGSLVDLVNSLGWKGTIILMLVLAIGGMVALYFTN
ncbi:DUF6366 family protein [Halalkalibacillus halophilus]|uniref:DUF6366 family protein n=1 Tax=Halalkalibacillus halophilus TaxID=392827 RepID=UPI0003F743DA|nr:DUF6366 family protein [Halalkalibacillus halophilus]